MSILDIIIIIFIALGFLSGFRRGIIKQGVITFGTILVVVLAFLLKDPLSMWERFCCFIDVLLEKI